MNYYFAAYNDYHKFRVRLNSQCATEHYRNTKIYHASQIPNRIPICLFTVPNSSHQTHAIIEQQYHNIIVYIGKSTNLIWTHARTTVCFPYLPHVQQALEILTCVCKARFQLVFHFNLFECIVLCLAIVGLMASAKCCVTVQVHGKLQST